MCVDLKHPEGLAVARRLVMTADVFVHNTAPGVIDWVGLDAETLRTDHERLVVVNLSG